MTCTCAGCNGNCAGHNCEIYCGRSCSGEPENDLTLSIAPAALPSIKERNKNREPNIMLDEVYAPSTICSRCIHYADSCVEPPCIDCLTPEIGSPNCKYEPTKTVRTKMVVLAFIDEHAIDIAATIILGTVLLALIEGRS